MFQYILSSLRLNSIGEYSHTNKNMLNKLLFAHDVIVALLIIIEIFFPPFSIYKC